MSGIPAPRDPIARAIFAALSAEQDKRDGRTVEQWMQAELDAVWRRCSELAGHTIDRSAVRLAMDRASGHDDYPHKVAHGCAELVNEHLRR